MTIEIIEKAKTFFKHNQRALDELINKHSDAHTYNEDGLKFNTQYRSLIKICTLLINYEHEGASILLNFLIPKTKNAFICYMNNENEVNKRQFIQAKIELAILLSAIYATLPHKEMTDITHYISTQLPRGYGEFADIDIKHIQQLASTLTRDNSALVEMNPGEAVPGLFAQPSFRRLLVGATTNMLDEVTTAVSSCFTWHRYHS